MQLIVGCITKFDASPSINGDTSVEIVAGMQRQERGRLVFVIVCTASVERLESRSQSTPLMICACKSTP